MFKLGTADYVCPYYGVREAVSNVDIILMPYNYLFDEEVKSSSKIIIKDAIVIIDEGHNIPRVAQDSCSFMFSQIDLFVIVKELKAIQEMNDSVKFLIFCTQSY